MEVTLSGVARDVGITGGGNQRVIIRMDNGMQVMAYIRPHLRWAQLGQEITVSGELRPLAKLQNPGGYNQFQHLRSQKVDSVIWAETVQVGEVRMSLTVALRMMRDRFAAIYDELLPMREAAVIRSMVLGDRADMDLDLADQYRAMGIFHILSISGLHVTILMLAFNKALGLFIEEQKCGIIVLGVMVLYCLMTGASTATVRAVTMGGVLVFGKVFKRKYDLITAVAWACAALLLYEPLFLFNVGFQLSFVAVFGIGILTAPVDRLLAKLRFPKLGEFRKGLAVGIAAVMATYPVFGFHFYELQLYSVIGNLVIAPTTTVILVMGVAVALVGLVWMQGAVVFAGPVYFILRFYEAVSGFFAGLPRALLAVSGGSLIVAAAAAAVLLSFAHAFNGFGESFRMRLYVFAVAVLLLLVAVHFRHNPRGLRVTALDTLGQYTVMRHRGDMLVAGIPRGGETVLLRYMDMHGTRRANGLVLLELPEPWDVRRLVVLAERFDVFYISGEGEGISASLAVAAFEEVAAELGTDMPRVARLYNGDIRAAGQKTVQITTDHTGRITLQIKHDSAVISIEVNDDIDQTPQN